MLFCLKTAPWPTTLTHTLSLNLKKRTVFPKDQSKCMPLGFGRLDFCLDKIHFGETIILAGLVSLFVRCSLMFVPHLWKLCDFVTFAILELHFWDLVQCLLISLCMGSEILVKIGLP